MEQDAASPVFSMSVAHVSHSTSSPQPPKSPSPARDSESADRRFKTFACRVHKPKVQALLKRPSPVDKTPKPRMPLRSKRIAAQSLSRIPTAKRGEYLVLKRLGHASAIAEPEASHKFDNLFGGRPKDDEALRELFPNSCKISGKRRRRRTSRARA